MSWRRNLSRCLRWSLMKWKDDSDRWPNKWMSWRCRWHSCQRPTPKLEEGVVLTTITVECSVTSQGFVANKDQLEELERDGQVLLASVVGVVALLGGRMEVRRLPRIFSKGRHSAQNVGFSPGTHHCISGEIINNMQHRNWRYRNEGFCWYWSRNFPSKWKI